MGKKIKILVADDNRNFCQMLRDYLGNQEGIGVIDVAYNGLDAWEIIQSQDPDLVILDLVMPHLDGLGVLENMNSLAMEARPKVIVLTAFGQESLANRAIMLGVDYFILKPFDLDILSKRIHSLTQEISLTPSEKYSSSSSVSKAVRDERNIASEVTEIMHQVGVPPHVKGYQYVRDAIIMVVEDVAFLGAVTKVLYPSIAKKYNTEPTRVERGIRHAIELAWERGKTDTLKRIFGYSMDIERQKPTNAEFIALLADRLRLMRNVS